MICLSSRLRGDWNIREDTGQGVENQPYTCADCMWTGMCIFNPGLFLLKRRLLNQLFLRTLPLALSNPSLFRSIFCFSSSCIQRQKKMGERKHDRNWSSGERMSVSPHRTGRFECRWGVWEGLSSQPRFLHSPSEASFRFKSSVGWTRGFRDRNDKQRRPRQ